MTSPSAPLPTRELERVESVIDHDLVEEMLRLFGKASRAHQLYLPNNPVYKAAHDALRAAFAPIWAEGEELVLTFTEHEVKHDGVIVLTEPIKGGDSLPWLFFKDGVRDVRLTRGFDGEELDRLFEILQRVRKASPDEDDLLTLLWQGDFTFLRYRYVDITMEQAAPLADGGERNMVESVDARAAVEEETQESQPSRAGVVDMSDFDSTLYFLDEKEIEYLQGEVRREYADDLRQNVVAILLDIFEQQPDAEIRSEIGEVLDNLMLHMLSAGQFHNVAYLIRESGTASQRGSELLAEHRDRLAQLPARLSAPEALTQLLQSLDENADSTPGADLLELFEQLRGGALGTVLEWLSRLQNPKLRPLLEQAAARLAAQNTTELVKLILSPTRAVSLEAVKRAGALKTPAAVAPVAKVLADGDVELRVASVQALAEIGSPNALQSLERAVEDPERDVRVATVRALQQRSYRPVLPRLEAIVKGKAVRDTDLTEKMAVFEAYGSLCGDAGIATLDGLLNGKSMLGRREDPELRACAAVALGRIGTAGARGALQKAASEKDVVVRNAVGRALKGVTA